MKISPWSIPGRLLGSVVLGVSGFIIGAVAGAISGIYEAWHDRPYTKSVKSAGQISRMLLLLAVFSLAGCNSSSQRTGYSAPRHHVNLDEVIARSRDLLDSVKAPRKDKFPYTVFSFQEAGHRGCIPCTDICGWAVHPGTIDITLGKHQLLPEHNGQPVPDMWLPPVMHRWLGGTEKSDYHYINQAIGSCLPE